MEIEQVTLHVDGSFKRYELKDKKRITIVGIGGFFVIKGKICHKFSETVVELPFYHMHEGYAILEGMKKALALGIKNITIKSDSLQFISLFRGERKGNTKSESLFLLHFLLLRNKFNNIKVKYHKRNNSDIAHNLSRQYIEKHKHLTPVFCEKNKTKKTNHGDSQILTYVFSTVFCN